MVKDVVYIGSCSGNVYALEKLSGRVVWAHNVGNRSFHSDPVIFDSALIISADSRFDLNQPGQVLALSLKAGSLLWEYDISELTGLGAGVVTDLIRYGETVVGVTTTDHLLQLDLHSGALLWEFQADYDPETNFWNSDPIMSGDTLYFGTIKGELYSIDMDDHSIIWNRDMRTRISTSLVFLNGSLYFGTADRRLNRIAASSGNVMKHLDVNGIPQFRITSQNNWINILYGDDVQTGGLLYADAVSSELSDVRALTSTDYENPITIREPYDFNGWVVTGDSQGNVYFHDVETGDTIYRFGVSGVIRSIGMEGDVLLIGTISGTVYAVRLIMST